MNLAVALVGWAAAAALLAAYALVSAGRLDGSGRAFQLLNLAGAAGLTLNSAAHRAWPSVALNAVWILIGVAALAGMSSAGTRLRRHPRSRRSRSAGGSGSGGAGLREDLAEQAP
ncbi:hypothetical protein AB0D08_02540 [Kitasatospora sp. NPDC048540]|uniref:CBU_0592 family membrane protein n=1 Tax=Kitasatospora sp. NPDC048540 TaxID=3155634 RepID=UPI0033E392E3